MISSRFRGLIKKHFQNNYLLYFILLILFIIGIIIGAILINTLNSEDKLRISSHFSWIFSSISEQDYKSIDIFKSSLFSNIKIALIVWVLGLFTIGIIIIPLIISWKGVAIGFTVGFLVKEFGIKGFVFSLTSLLPHYLIIIPGFLAIGAIGISNSIHCRKSRGKKAYQRDLIDYIILFFLFLIIILFGCFVEGFFIPYIINLIGLSL